MPVFIKKKICTVAKCHGTNKMRTFQFDSLVLRETVLWMLIHFNIKQLAHFLPNKLVDFSLKPFLRHFTKYSAISICAENNIKLIFLVGTYLCSVDLDSNNIDFVGLYHTSEMRGWLAQLTLCGTLPSTFPSLAVTNITWSAWPHPIWLIFGDTIAINSTEPTLAGSTAAITIIATDSISSLFVSNTFNVFFKCTTSVNCASSS